MVIVSVKWQKETFKDVEIDTSQPPIVFKGQLYALTGVPPERQKVMVKGGMLQDDGDWSSYAVKEGQRLMMMGTADAVPTAPQAAPVFVEDLPEEDQDAATIKGFTAGLVNLGNTCYMNSTLQCLHSVPELKGALTSYLPSSGIEQDSSHKLTLATRELFGELDRSLRPVAPFRFLMLLREKYPQFGQTDPERGTYLQQDAEECWTQLVYTLSQRLRDMHTPAESVINNLFGIEMRNIVKCVESGEESTETEVVNSLKCHITSEVNQLHEGLKGGLKGELEKVSPALGRSAIHIKESLIGSLPQYMTVQFVRFFWKRESQQKAKILRKVAYPLVLDVYDFCTAELKSKLDVSRKSLRLQEDVKHGLVAGKQKEKKEEASSSEGKKEGGDTPMLPASEPGADGSSATPPSVAAVQSGGSEQTGVYDLMAVLTHKGRSADSGHYVAWVKQESGQWIEFDDEKPISRREEDITNLSGGGDWHMAYILVYKARLVSSA